MNDARARVHVRRARVEDAALVYRWRNDPFILNGSGSLREVGWDEHLAWMGRTLGNPARLLLIAEVDGTPAGQVRFELLRPGEAVITTALAETFTDRGLGVEAIRAGVSEVTRLWGSLTLVAWVRADNAWARKAFVKAGFQPQPRLDTPDQHECLVRHADEAGGGTHVWTEDDLRSAAYYDGLVRQHGAAHRGLAWGSQESQQRCFEVLCDGLPLRGARVLDVGCGTGDLLLFLRERGIDCEYTGLDVSPAMVATAAARIPGARFLRGSVLEPVPDLGREFDCVVASGVFAHRRAHPREFLHAVAARMFALCRRGVAFNTLSCWGERLEPDGFRRRDEPVAGPMGAASRTALLRPQTPDEFRADPAETLAFCRSLTPRVALRHDYHAGDFTVFLFRG